MYLIYNVAKGLSVLHEINIRKKSTDILDLRPYSWLLATMQGQIYRCFMLRLVIDMIAGNEYPSIRVSAYMYMHGLPDVGHGGSRLTPCTTWLIT